MTEKINMAAQEAIKSAKSLRRSKRWIRVSKFTPMRKFALKEAQFWAESAETHAKLVSIFSEYRIE